MTSIPFILLMLLPSPSHTDRAIILARSKSSCIQRTYYLMQNGIDPIKEMSNFIVIRHLLVMWSMLSTTVADTALSQSRRRKRRLLKKIARPLSLAMWPSSKMIPVARKLVASIPSRIPTGQVSIIWDSCSLCYDAD